MSTLKENNTLRLIIACLVVGLISVAILYGAEKIPSTHPAWKSVVTSVGGLGLASIAISLIWEFFQKRGFTQELLEQFRLSENIDQSGLEKITYRFDEVDWKVLFENCTHFDLFITYGRYWRGTNEIRLIELAMRAGAKVRIVLPDPANADLIKQFATRYRKPEPDMKKLIEESIVAFKHLFKDRAAAFEIRVSDRPPTNTYYRFGEKILVTLYNYNDGKGNIPVLLMKQGGRLADFFEYEFEYLWSSGKKAKQPNQTPEPTALLVTISACAELAPSSAVAHL